MKNPLVEHRGDALALVWPEDGYEIAVDQLHDESAGLHGEVTVSTTTLMESGRPGHVHWARVNLSSTVARSTLAKHLTKRVDTVDWHSMVEATAVLVCREVRSGPPLMRLKDVQENRYVQYHVPKLLPMRESTIIYGRGGGAKGWLACAIAITTAAGIALPGLGLPRTCPVLYLDWEADAPETRRRMGWLCRGFGLAELPSSLLYIRLDAQPLVKVGPVIRRHIAAEHVGLVVVDSLVPATEDDPRDPSPARAAMEAMRTLEGTTRLVIGHMTKAESRLSGGEATAFGSVFYENLARSMWQFRCWNRSRSGVTIGLTHTKVNMGVQFEPVGFRLEWDDQNALATISSVSAEDEPSLASHLPLKERIRLALKRGQKTTSTLAEELDIDASVIRAECNRMDDVRNYVSRAGRGAEASWGLLAEREEKA